MPMILEMDCVCIFLIALSQFHLTDRLLEKIMPDKATWQFINSFAPWLAALGTLLAVIVSLYFARRDKQIRISISAYIATLINNLNNSNKSNRYLCVEVTNIGHRTANITSINWKIGIFHKRRLEQVLAINPISSKLPIKLIDVDIANYYFPLDDFRKNLENFRKCFSTTFIELETRFILIRALSSTGHIFESRIDKNLREWFIDNLNCLDASSNKC